MLSGVGDPARVKSLVLELEEVVAAACVGLWKVLMLVRRLTVPPGVRLPRLSIVPIMLFLRDTTLFVDAAKDF